MGARAGHGLGHTEQCLWLRLAGGESVYLRLVESDALWILFSRSSAA